MASDVLTEPTWDRVLKRNSIERMKQEKFPLDIVDELPRLIELGYEAVPEEDIVRLNWWGLTHDKPKIGTFMVRIKVPGGLITPDQLRGIGRISREYGRNYTELTTRQGIQLHWVRLDQLPEVLQAIQATGLTTVGGEGDTVRNITSCPVAGIERGEVFDVRPVIEKVAAFFWGNRDYSNLPRKHKYTISACPFQCNAPEIHDVALLAVIKDGRPGFAVRVGGGLSSTPRLARDLDIFVPVEETVEVLRAITDTWQHNLRYRVSRAKARIKFMVDDYGPEGVRRMVEERLGRKLERVRAPEPVGEADHLGVHPQKQEGLVYVGVPVPMGWITGDQLERLGDIVEELGADVRFTRQQNFIVGNVPEDRLEWLKGQLRDLGFPIDRNPIYGRSIACTSHRFCNYSVAETKGKLQEILEELDRRFGEEVQGLRIFMDGCPHACAHHWVGDIGLQGTTARSDDGEKVEAYDITMRGGLGPNPAIGRPILRRVPAEETTAAIVRLVEAWLTERRARNGSGASFSFRDFCNARSDAELRAIALPGAAVEEEAPRYAVLRISGPFLDFTGGIDHFEAQARTVGQLIEAATRNYPALQSQILGPDGGLNENINLFLNEEDVRGLQGLDTPVKPGDEVVVLPALAGG